MHSNTKIINTQINEVVNNFKNHFTQKEESLDKFLNIFLNLEKYNNNEFKIELEVIGAYYHEIKITIEELLDILFKIEHLLMSNLAKQKLLNDNYFQCKDFFHKITTYTAKGYFFHELMSGRQKLYTENDNSVHYRIHLKWLTSLINYIDTNKKTI